MRKKVALWGLTVNDLSQAGDWAEEGRAKEEGWGNSLESEESKKMATRDEMGTRIRRGRRQ